MWNNLRNLIAYFKKHPVAVIRLAIAVAGLLFVFWLWLGEKWSVPTLAVICFLLAVIYVLVLILGQASHSPNFFRAALSAVLSLSFLLLSLWLLVNLFWPARHNLYHVKSIPIGDSGILKILYPNTVLADAESTELSFVWEPSTNMTVPFTVNVKALSPALQADLPLPYTLFTWVPSTATAKPPSTWAGTFVIRNRRTVKGDILFNRLKIQEIRFEAGPLDFAQTKMLSTTLPVYVETEWGYTMRTFVNDAVTERSPLLLAMTGLLAAAGFMFQQYLTSGEKREAKKEQENERFFRLEIDNFKTRLREQNRDQLTKVWEELINRGQSLALSIELRRDLETARALWRIVQSDGPLFSLVQSAKDWPNECVAAYLLVYKERRIGKLGELISVRQRLAKDGVSQDLLDDLKRIEQEESVLHSLPRNWPADLFTSYLRPPHQEKDNRQQSKSDKFAKLLAWERAEQDAYNLFKTDGFWPRHEIVSRLKALDRPTIVCGVPGSGRTTFALDLARYSLPNSQLALYLAQEPLLEDIQTGFGQLLLAFIKDHPILLGRLRTHERNALISLLAVSLGQTFVVAELDAAYRNIEEARNLPGRTDGDQQQNEVRERIALSYIAQFSQEIMSGPWPITMTPTAWANLLRRSAESLGFSDQRPRLVLDVGMNSANWWNSAIAPYVWTWHRNGVNVVLLIPAAELGQLHHTSQFDILTIDWDQTSLMGMISHRAEKVLPHRLTIADLFEDEALNRLIEASKDESGSYTPRRWIQLWNRTIQLASPNQEIITEVLVERVLISK